MRYVTSKYLERRFGLSGDVARDIIQRRMLHALVLNWLPWLWLVLSGTGLVTTYLYHVNGNEILGLLALTLLGWATVARLVAERAIIDTARRLAARLADSAPRGDDGRH